MTYQLAASEKDSGCSKTAAVGLEGVTKTYGGGEGTVRTLDDVSVVFEPGTFTACARPPAATAGRS
jgi:hypothetical protein